MASNARQAFIDELNSTVTGIDDFIDTPIPVLTEITTSFDADNPTRNNEILAYNVNKILRAFQGLTPIELILRIGQKNETMQAMLLAALEYVGGGENSLTVISPIADGEYYGWFDTCICDITGGTVKSVSVTFDGESFPMEASGDSRYTCITALAIGSHTATIKANFDDNTSTETTVTFEVKHWSEIVTIPGDMQSYTTLPLISAETGAITEDLTGVECTYDDGGENTGLWTLVKGSPGWIFDNIETLAAGTYNAVFTFCYTSAGIAHKTISFIIE